MFDNITKDDDETLQNTRKSNWCSPKKTSPKKTNTKS